jgi:hypothetical protein
VLERASQALAQGRSPLPQVLERFLDGLCQVRRASTSSAWAEFLSHCRKGHPVLERLSHSPLSGRALRKPRGYPGDAETLDYIYGGPHLPAQIPAAQQVLYDWEYQTDACVAVRARRDALSTLIDAVVSSRPEPHILSVACGHLREVHGTAALRQGRLGRLTGLDQDRESLARVSRELPSDSVHPLHGSVRELLSQGLSLGKQDLIYSAGLYDYLPQSVAERLSVRLVELLAPGGRLVLINFAPGLRDIGYMETAMDWQLIYRGEQALRALLRRVPESELERVETRTLSGGDLVVLEVRRRP